MNGKAILCVSFWFILYGLSMQSHAQTMESIKKPLRGQTMRATSGNPINNSDSWRFKPGETRVIANLKGPGEIRHMWFAPSSDNIRYPSALVLRIYWDGSKIPSVETPLGDFFAAGNGMRAEVYSLPVKVSSFGRAYNCYWQMPFGKEAKITLTNESEVYDAGCYFMIDWVQDTSLLQSEVMYFHARYHQDYDPVYGEFYTVFEGKGKGHYVGTVLSSVSRHPHWYGEGDDIWWMGKRHLHCTVRDWKIISTKPGICEYIQVCIVDVPFLSRVCPMPELLPIAGISLTLLFLTSP